MYFIFPSDGEAPPPKKKRRGARGNLPLPIPVFRQLSAQFTSVALWTP